MRVGNKDLQRLRKIIDPNENNYYGKPKRKLRSKKILSERLELFDRRNFHWIFLDIILAIFGFILERQAQIQPLAQGDQRIGCRSKMRFGTDPRGGTDQ